MYCILSVGMFNFNNGLVLVPPNGDSRDAQCKVGGYDSGSTWLLAIVAFLAKGYL